MNNLQQNTDTSSDVYVSLFSTKQTPHFIYLWLSMLVLKTVHTTCVLIINRIYNGDILCPSIVMP
jgi:hypothetical protein